MPYKIGKSAALRQGNAVEVRGFPLGVMQAVSGGKVVNPYDRDQEQGWDHVDFVIDALLAEGNSGSPVLAASCKSRDLELVGVYHAGYKGHGALNVVVGIDQLTEFMHKKRAPPARAHRGWAGRARRRRSRAPQGGARRRAPCPCSTSAASSSGPRTADGVLLYHVYGRQFPLDDRRVAVIEDLPKDGAFGELGRLWVLGQTGWREWPPSALGTDEHDLLARVGDSIRLQILHTVDYRKALANPGSPDERRARARSVARDRPRRPRRARSGLQPARHRRSAVVGARSRHRGRRPSPARRRRRRPRRYRRRRRPRRSARRSRPPPHRNGRAGQL